MADPHSEHGFHITIGASPSGKLNLDTDLRMVKAAMLYADRVTLCSPATSMILSTLALGSFSNKQQIDYLESVMPLLISDEAELRQLLAGIEAYKGMVNRKRKTREELIFQRKFEAAMSGQWRKVKDTVEGLASAAGADGIVDAVESGILQLHIFEESENTDEMVDEYLEILGNMMSDASTFPMFDNMTSKIVKRALSEGKISVSKVQLSRGKNVALASAVLERLPLFDLAKVDEIMSIRKELYRPLSKFRSALMKLSDEIESTILDTDFGFEAEIIFYKEIQPAILEIEEAANSNLYLKELMGRIINRPLVLPGGSAISLVISQMSNMPDLALQALGLGLGAGAAVMGYDAYRAWREKAASLKQNQLFFYYQAGKLLEK